MSRPSASALGQALIMEAVYRLPGKEGQNALAEMGYEVAEAFGTDGVQGYTLDDQETGEIVVALPGSNELKDWWRYDLLAYPPRHVDDLWLHRGFVDAAMLIDEWLVAQTPSLVIGHSFSAAIVQLVAAFRNLRGVAFAPPRPLLSGDHAAPCMCWARTDDFVCNLPTPVPRLLPWRHLGEVKWLMPLNHEETAGEDHRIANYVQILRRLERDAAS